MPPAFVLSQDQTLRKKNFLSEIPIQAIYLRLTLKKNFSRFTSHYSIFNQPALEGQRVLNISSSTIFSNRFLKIFRTFFISPVTRANLKQSVTGRKTSFNIASTKYFASRFFTFFRVFSGKRRLGALMRTRATVRNTSAVGQVGQLRPLGRARLSA